MNIKNIVIAILALAIVAATIWFAVDFNSEDTAQIPSNTPVEDVEGQNLLEFNHERIASEQAEIAKYLEFLDFELTKAENSCYYHIIDSVSGRPIQKGSRVCMSYEVTTLDGTLCYSSDDDGNKCFTVGQRQVPKGLDELMPLFTDKSEVFVVIPSHLAYGVAGDRNKIGPYTPITYWIKIISVE